MDRVTESLTSVGFVCKRYCLGEMEIEYCLGCRKCESDNRCVHDDDMNILYSEIKACDGVLIGSPSYWGDITGQLKVFIDRSLHLCNTRTGKSILPHGKFAGSIAVRSGELDAENLRIIQTLEHYFRHLDMNPLVRLSVTGASRPADVAANEALMKKLNKFGSHLKKEIEKSRESVTQ